MVGPFANMTLKGWLWYQGENNVGRGTKNPYYPTKNGINKIDTHTIKMMQTKNHINVNENGLKHKTKRVRVPDACDD